MRGALTILICVTTFALGNVVNFNKCPRDGTNERLLPHEKCNRFYQCVGSKLVTQRCPAELRFNIETQLCDWADIVNCGERNNDESEEIPEEEPENSIINDDPSLAPIICAAEDSDGVLVSHEDCDKFYVCSGGNRVVMQCPPPNLLYNPIHEQCDWPANVKCPVKLPKDDSETSDEKDGEDDDTNKGNYDPSLAREICAAVGSDGVLVAHEYCTKFYKCSHRIPVTQRCPLMLLYNPRKEQCDWPTNVICGTRIIPDPDSETDTDTDTEEENESDSAENGGVNDDPSEAPAICAANGSDGVLVAHEYCNKFYKCANRVPVALLCQLNLLYNPSKEQCDWPENVDCNDRIN